MQIWSRNRSSTPLSLELQAVFYYQKELLNDISTVDSSLTNYPDEKLLNILLYGSEYFRVKTNRSTLQSNFLKTSERFDDPLFLKIKK